MLFRGLVCTKFAMLTSSNKIYNFGNLHLAVPKAVCKKNIWVSLFHCANEAFGEQILLVQNILLWTKKNLSSYFSGNAL